MAHLPKQLRIMRRLLTIAACLMCWMSAQAQNYKPLEKVKVPADAVQIVKPRTLNPRQNYYMAAHNNGENVMTADFSVPAECQIIFGYNSAIDSDCTIACLQVGGVKYYPQVIFTGPVGRVILISQDHLKHIAVSGLQSITYMKEGEAMYTDNYDLVGQELWRRTAEELGKAAYIIY